MLQDKQKQRITLKIDCHSIVLTVNREDEPFYRLAADKVNAVYRKTVQRYPNQPVEMLWLYVALEIAVELQVNMGDKSLQALLEKIGELNEKVLQIVRTEQI